MCCLITQIIGTANEDKLSRDLSPNHERDEVPVRLQVCPQRSCGQELHVSTLVHVYKTASVQNSLCRQFLY